MKTFFVTATSIGTIALTNYSAVYEVKAEETDWSGFYIGLKAGAKFSEDNFQMAGAGSGAEDFSFKSGIPRFSPAVPFSAVSNSGGFAAWPGSGAVAQSVFLGGLAGGYNWQRGNLLFGLEMDGSLAGRGDGAVSWAAREAFDGGSATGTGTRMSAVQHSARIDWLYTLRPRFGFTMNRLLMFGTAGLAVGQMTLETSAAVDEQYNDPGKGGGSHTARSRWAGSKSSIRAGYVVGGGIEYAIGDHVSVGVEGLYFDLGKSKATATGAGSCTANGGPDTTMSVEPYMIERQVDGGIVRAGVNWRF